MTERLDPFPLATGLAARVGDQIADLVAGGRPELLEKVTPTTAELLKFWFQQDYCDVRALNFHEGQRAAILHVIYAHEVIAARTLRQLYEAVAGEAMLESGVLGEVTRERHAHPKYAAKMATGTGKTWVLNALLVWQYLNKLTNPRDERFTANFLVVAPGLIVYDRLLDSFQGKTIDGDRDFTTSDIYQQRDLFIPDNFRTPVFGFLQSSVVTKAEIGRKVTGVWAYCNHELASAGRTGGPGLRNGSRRRRCSWAGHRSQGSSGELLPADTGHQRRQLAGHPRSAIPPWRPATSTQRPTRSVGIQRRSTSHP